MSKPGELIPVPLYHGTATLFLEGILEFGLGGKNPIAELKVLDFARTIAPLVPGLPPPRPAVRPAPDGRAVECSIQFSARSCISFACAFHGYPLCSKQEVRL